MNLTIEHNLDNNQLRKALAGMAIGSGIEHEMIETLQMAVCACDDKQPKEPRHPAMKELYRALQRELAKVAEDIEQDAAAISGLSQLMKAAGAPTQLTADQLQALQRAIQDRYGYLAAQLQSVDYQPPVDMLDRWKQLGLVHQSVTPETFAATVSSDMYFVRNAFLMGKFVEAVESGKSFAEVMEIARYAPLLKPDLEAIQIAEQQTAMYLQDNAADLATKIGQLAIKQRNDTIRQMAVDFHSRKLTRTVLDVEEKQAIGIPTPARPVESWREFATELHHTVDDTTRDLARVAYYELTDAQKQGQAHRLLQDGNVDKLVYKMPLPTACAQCKYAYLLPDEKTPRLFKLSALVNNGTNIGRKAHPLRGGKVAPGGRNDGQETKKAVVGLMHPWCACQGPYEATGYEPWLTDKQKQLIAGQRHSTKKASPK